MARLKKNGNLSGAVGNLVFVNDGDRVYVREKGNKPKQTKNTKAEAEKFALAGVKEKLYRNLLKDKIGLVSHQYQAVKHKTRLLKTISSKVTESGTTLLSFQDPEAMIGFNFNPKVEWQRYTNFYPKYNEIVDQTMSIGLPALAWGDQIRAPKNATTAKLNFYAVSTNLNFKVVDVEVLSSLSLLLREKENVPAQDWSFSIPQNTKWLFIIATLDFESTKTQLEKTGKNVGTYLWAQTVNP
ncbi:hypothetical protein PQ459_14515 [Chryseobacterium sp. KACC 21268]|nr:hypothetical protein PQ459_14515 [Chryseobacterium sp. KACC 21268]